MTLVKNFLSNPPVGSIRTRIEQLIDQGNYQSNNTFIDIVERAKFIKATLGLIQEMCYDRDNRIGFYEHSKLNHLPKRYNSLFIMFSLPAATILEVYDWSSLEMLDDNKRL